MHCVFFPQHKGGRQGSDMNVERAWARGLSGKGVSVTILDDGLQWQHPDLLQNYVRIYTEQCHDFNVLFLLQINQILTANKLN